MTQPILLMAQIVLCVHRDGDHRDGNYRDGVDVHVVPAHSSNDRNRRAHGSNDRNRRAHGSNDQNSVLEWCTFQNHDLYVTEELLIGMQIGNHSQQYKPYGKGNVRYLYLLYIEDIFRFVF